MSTTDSPTPPAQPAVLTEIRGRVLVITLNRPDQMNAINTALAQGLLGAVRQLDEDPALTVGVLTGAGRGFCAGMDLKAFATEGGPVGMDEFIRNGAQKPLIAAIEGFALAGGLELALSCDLLVAAAGVKIGIPEVNVGLFAAGGGLLRLPRVLPYAVAMELALTADPITAEQAHSYGLVSRVSEKGGALEMAITLAERIAKNAPLGVAASKQLIRASLDQTEAEFWEFQKSFMGKVFTSADAKEGPAAFAQKRQPNWTGK
jgi:enoyl-CoA hydratase